MGNSAGEWHTGAEVVQRNNMQETTNRDHHPITPGLTQALTGCSQIGQPAGTPNMAAGRVLFQTPAGGGDQQRIEEQPAVEKTIAEAVKAQSEQERKQEFAWQMELGANKKVEFREEVLNTEQLQLFAVVKENSAALTIIHGLRKYYNGETAPELRGKVLARVGDWTSIAQPYIVLLSLSLLLSIQHCMS
jgi:hypothetical protein